jgi:hypothetical protein
LNSAKSLLLNILSGLIAV